MLINGKERYFKLTVGAAAEISELCPEGDIDRLQELLEGAQFAKTARTMAKVVVALNRGYADSIDARNEKADVLTVREVLALDIAEFKAAVEEAMTSFRQDKKGEVSITPKKNEGLTEEAL